MRRPRRRSPTTSLSGSSAVASRRRARSRAQTFEEAASLRDRERRLTRAARRLEAAWRGVDLPERPVRLAGAEVGASAYARSAAARLPFVVAIVLATTAFPLGLLAGWPIWG